MRQAGGWDPFNVTEDADLGLRLFRCGYRLDTLRLPTYEEAPTEYGVWTKQRTRWLKGWIQTWLVLMRHPIQTFKNIGFRSFMVAQILFVGLLLSSALHLFIIIVYLGSLIANLGGFDGIVNVTPLFAFDLLNFFLGYLSFFTLGYITTRIDNPKIDTLKVALTLPLYWAFLSVAAWRAIGQLITRPHYWEKTPHKPVMRN